MNIRSLQLHSNIGRLETPLAVTTSPVASPIAPAAPVALDGVMVELSQVEAPRNGVQNLQLFGGDRKTAIGTLIASGAKAENPDVGFFGDVFRKLFGGTKTKSKNISPSQTIATQVKVKNFNLKKLRLTTRDGQTVRHIDFQNQKPTGGTAQVKDVGSVIAQGQVKRMFEQELTTTPNGQKQIENSFFDPKTGQNFLRTTETTNKIETTKMGTIQSDKAKSSLRQIEVLGPNGEADRRYVFSYGQSVRLENLDADGQVVSTYNLSKKTDFFELVDRLSANPPSARSESVAPAFPAGGVGGGGGIGLERFNVHQV